MLSDAVQAVRSLNKCLESVYKKRFKKRTLGILYNFYLLKEKTYIKFRLSGQKNGMILKYNYLLFAKAGHKARNKEAFSDKLHSSHTIIFHKLKNSLSYNL